MIMNKSRMFLRLFLLACLLTATQGVWADRFLQEPSGFTAIVQGIDRIRFTLPTQYDGVRNEGISEGIIYVSENEGPKKEFLTWGMGKGYNDLTSDTESGKITLKVTYDGDWQLVGKVTGGHRYFEKNTNVTFTVNCNDDNSDHFTTVVDWTVPRELRGKKYTFYLWCKSEEVFDSWYIPEGCSDKSRTYMMGEWDCPAAADVSITINEPMLSYDANQSNCIMFPYTIQAKSVKTATIFYTDSLTGAGYSKRLSTKLIDIASLPADRPWKNIMIRADLKDSEGKDASIESNVLQSDMMHFPKNLKARVQSDGSVKLTWTVDHAELGDFDDSDNFEIQRNVNGTTDPNDPDWTTIAMELSFVKGQSTYSYTDDDLINRYKGKPVTYRVRRSAATLWKWNPGSGYTMQVMSAPLALPGFADAFVHRSGTWTDDEHNVTFYFTNGPKYDGENRFIVRNNADWDEAQQLIKKGSLDYSRVVMVLMDENDWEAFAKRVNGGAEKLNAVMMTDIDIQDSQQSVGNQNRYYSGTFNGFGNTLTVHYTGSGNHKAPFERVDNAVIKNLTVDGSVTSSSKFAGGLVGYVSNNVEIERCVVNVDLVSQVDGDGSSGGLIGYIQTKSKATISNSAFTGSIQGDKTNCNGGFIGVALQDTKVTLTNCLFSPVSLPIDGRGCRTFARTDNSTTLTITNCYYTMVYGQYEAGGKAYFVIQKDQDWLSFRNLVAQANGGEVNAVLLIDVTVSDPIGTESKPFNGIFEGNGHTLTANIKTSVWSAAPFAFVGNAEFRNLTVKGSIKGGIHSAGLIGSSLDGKTVNIQNVHVSAQVTTTDKYAGGFVGHGHTANHTINNCRFDGTITALGGSESYAAAFIGWESGNTSNKLTNCYENGVFIGIDHAAMNYVYMTTGAYAYGNSVVCQNNYSSHNWGEMGEDKYRKVTDSSSLAAALGSGWIYTDGIVVPKMSTVEVTTQGQSAVTMTPDQIHTAIGNDTWHEVEGNIVPVMDVSTDNAYSITLWDKRAKMLLYTHMKGENKTETSIVDISGNEDAIKKHEFTWNLTRKCVDYDFDLVIKRGSSPFGIAGTEADTLAQHVTKTDAGDLANYKFMNMNTITSFTPQKKQSSVRLTWEVSGGDCDYYRLLRRNHSNNPNAQWTDTIAPNLIQQFYEDKTVYVQQAYDYRVESVLECEGTHISSAEVQGAECVATGRVSGYVRMADGTAMAGVVVTCTPGSGTRGASSEYKQTTDETGFYEFTDLPYQTTGKYYITVGNGGYTGPNTNGEVTFTQRSNWTQNFNFYMDTYYVYSGHVYYRDTSIPVPGVSFKLDGNVMYDASQQMITTDNQGAFALSIPAGAHRVQAEKDGHHFVNDGFLINRDAPNDSTLYNFTKNVSMVSLWDLTTVVLRGRVVGGDDQGNLPLGQSQSVNNLGDSLKIVMQLEGDDASYLIRLQDDETVKSADYKVAFGLDNKDTTQVNVTRHTLTIRPDKKTGEYQIELHPAKYKVVEVSAQGYATLFQQGKVGETVDLMSKKQGDVCEYNRIYHAVPTVDVKQFNVGDEPFYGVKKVTATDNIGNKSVINTWYWKKLSSTDSIGVYSFKYPVFMASSPYGWMLQACEKYYYNNNTNRVPDIVKLHGGRVTIKNDLISDNDNKVLDLDEEGGVSYIFTPQNKSFLLADDNALKTVSITLEYDNSFFDIKPMNGEILKGYVMATIPKAEGRKSIASGTPQLIDILRDPPGGGSSAYLEAGSKLSYTYNADLNGSGGLTFSLIQGQNANIYNGTVIVPSFGSFGSEAGTFMDSSKKNVFSIDAITYYSFGWNFSYNFDVTERIQTLNSKKWVGGKADLFMGMTTDVMIEDAIALRVVPDSMYQIYKTHEGGSFQATDGQGNTSTVKVLTGTAKVLVEGVDDTGKPVYLIRDEVLALGPKLNSTFIHSQHYIENELLPDLIKLRNSLILPMGTSASYAKELAKQKGYTTYVSKVPEDDVLFGYRDSYICYDPDNGVQCDSILSLNQTAEAWLFILAENERQKIEVSESDLVKRYDFDGGTSIQYSESFSATRTYNQSLRYPGINDLGQVTNGILPTIKLLIESAKRWLEINGKNVDNKPYLVRTTTEAKSTIEIKAGGSYLCLKITPQVTLNFTDKSGMTQTDSKKIGFTMSTSSKSSLTVDVYRTANEQTLERDETYKDDFTGGFTNVTIDILDMLRTGKLGTNPQDYLGESEKVYSSFVYRTRGGVTCEPYEKERTTKWYQPGTVIDVATIPADKPRIWIDEPVVSNVPYDEPARFTLHMANESDYPERASLIFNYYLLASSNPNGAKVYVDGTPINSQGVNIVLYPCRDNNNDVMVFTKQIEVYPGQEFDYNDLTLCLYDPDDAARVFDCKFSAHFVPTAGKVNISSPGNKWVVNTESPYDGKYKAWYMPVRIDGFDVNYRGFDHIELQYKLSTQGDKDWVSVCSYYADKELMAKASGVTDTIPENGTIIAPFYGDVDPVEQYYDLRAVNYCRHGNGFLTRSSEILTGIKDTRLPVAFGTPEPTDGILGIGDDIKITFSEPIAANHLRNINNFEVLGQLNSQDISTSTCLTFNGQGIALSQASRNLSGKSFTLDMMLNPVNNNKEMAVFYHGTDMNGVSFGLTADRHLMAVINGKTVYSDSIVNFTGVLQPVAWSFDESGEDMVVTFFDGIKKIGSKKVEGKYEGSSKLIFGIGPSGDDHETGVFYQGDMLEVRLWNHAMTSSELDAHQKKRLTGFENGLLNYYPMNEGEGEWAYDNAPSSMDLVLYNSLWKLPPGISLAMKGDKGLQLAPDKFSRSAVHDYTLMFWFRSEDSNGTLFANGEALSGQEDEINIGLNEGLLYVRSAGFEEKTKQALPTHTWHHFAMSVSRSQNIANVYVDKKLVMSFPAENLSGIQGDHIALGATYANYKPTKVLNGHIDEVAMFACALPVNLIREFSTHAPKGTMSALMAYLDFGRSEKMDDNTQHLEPTGISLKRYVDNQGKILARRDTLVAASAVSELADRITYAPMTSTVQMDNLNYNFVAHDNQLLINITEPDYTVEKTNVYVTVKEIPDLQGNLMASPITMDLFVYQNPLRWSVKNVERNIPYGKGDTFSVTVKNLSGVSQYFEIEDLPVWINASQTNGTIDPLGEQSITFTVSSYINVGTYTEQITLVGENSMSEPLPVTLNVQGEAPQWVVGDRLRQMNQTMMMVTQVKIGNVIATSPNDVLAVFDDQLQTLGVAHIEMNNRANANEALAYITIYGYSYDDGSWPTLHFRFYDAQTGKIYNLKSEDGTVYTFEKDALIGSATKPVVLLNDNTQNVQVLRLKKGWNWVTFNVQPYKKTAEGFFDSMSRWEAGDIVTTVNGTTVEQFTCRENKESATGYTWDNPTDIITIHPDQMYNIYSMSDKTVYVAGLTIYADIAVGKDWNRIGFLSAINLPVAQAMADYEQYASVGDVLKSQDAFAIASSIGQGMVTWKGSLQYMEVGKGYMLKRLGSDKVSFSYPIYFDENRYSGKTNSRVTRSDAVCTATTMNIVATVEGIDTEATDRLVVFRGAERISEAMADDEQLYYLNIGSDDKADGTFTFAIEREGEIIATTPTRMTYVPNGLIGTPNDPTAISFTSLDQMPHDGLWYTVGGVKMGAKKPIQSGVYIYNGKAILIGK